MLAIIDTILQAIIIIVILVFMFRTVEKVREDDIKEQLDEMILETALKSKILDIIDDEERFVNSDISKDDYHKFKGFYVMGIYNEMMQNIEKDGCKYLNCLTVKLDMTKISRKLAKLLDNGIVSARIYELFHTVDGRNMGNGFIDIIEESQRIEEEAIKYHKQFGEEPEGDPELHPREPNSDEDTNGEIQYKSLEELSSMGTVEDIEEDE